MGSIEPIPTDIFPCDNSTTSFWRTELDELDDHRSTSELPKSCDILIIGAGYAGISAAYHLLVGNESATPKPSVVLLEARQACSGATGRNGGHLRPSVYSRIPRYEEEFGLDAAVELADFELDHVTAIAELVKKHNIDCDFQLTRSFDVHQVPGAAEKAKRDYLDLKERGIAKSTINDLEWTDADRCEEVSGVKNSVGCFSFTAASLWPYKLFVSLLRLSLATGSLNLQTHTPALSLHPSPDSTQTAPKWNIITPRGQITASKVIVATNAYTAGLLPEYTSKIVPSKGICCHITCPPGITPPKLPSTYGLRLANGSFDYLIQRPDGSIIVGGARSTFFSDHKNWYNNVDDSTLISPAANYFGNYMQDNFIGWENSGAKVERIWTGIMGYNSDTLPSVGEVLGREGVFVAAGFEGHGMPLIWLVMKGITEMATEGKKFEEVRIPRIFKTTEERLLSGVDALAPKK